QLRRCVLKRAARHAQLSRSGQDARDRLRHEAEVLALLAPNARVPRVFDLIEHAGDLILVLEDLPGEPLSGYVARLARRGCMLPESQVVRLGCALVALLQTIHDRGFVYRDLKPANVLLGGDDQVYLIDFELAHSLDSPLPPAGRGTTGYMSQQQASGAPPSVADDVYSLGALLYCAATGAEPGFTPQPYAPLSRPLHLLNPTLSPALSTIISRCLLPDPAARPSLHELATLLAAAGDSSGVTQLAGSATPRPHATSDSVQFRHLARRLADSLCAAARWLPDGRGPVWDCALYHGAGIWSRDLYAGSAGTLLVLAVLVAEFRSAQDAALLREGISALLRAPRPAEAPLAGLYFGEGSIALATFAAGQALGDAELIAAAGERCHAVAGLPCHAPDLMTGASGRIRLHLLLWEATADPGQLAHAVAMGELLLSLAEPIDGGLCWTLPLDYGSLSGKRLLGYAHGAAGIGDALLDLFAATRDERFHTAAQAAARWIMAQATPALNDGSGLIWPREPGGDPSGGSWCHGAAGIGRFLLHLAAHGDVPERAATMAERAARMVGRGARWSGPTQCHGLAGNIGFLLDVFQATGDCAHLDQAYAQARLLDGFIVEQAGRLVCQSDLPAIFTPDLMLGYGGVILCLLRLSQPERGYSLLKVLGL
ncbi:MAG TPA: lanthionine synthetase LanC family protein, partial [Herpetosiphonaceae bacterium]